ncbi:hypothetical protein CWO17_18585 [Vibrio sp. 10N.286.45.A3]|nr:hypothetical protein BCU50_20510 [Vibrio sp. 10N.286.46.E10]PMI91037.1 hypothetical protein BCU34_22090 [Vibrio sp. 10N.286.45.E10]PTO99740.1 hypothetical protein CWO17_18585 [Vibrio sp. 10N.286.45.A3]PTQ19362.1 hypothetical protein CWO24_23185 [Vibrio sp. 10N.286.46.E10]
MGRNGKYFSKSKLLKIVYLDASEPPTDALRLSTHFLSTSKLIAEQIEMIDISFSKYEVALKQIIRTWFVVIFQKTGILVKSLVSDQKINQRVTFACNLKACHDTNTTL